MEAFDGSQYVKDDVIRRLDYISKQMTPEDSSSIFTVFAKSIRNWPDTLNIPMSLLEILNLTSLGITNEPAGIPLLKDFLLVIPVNADLYRTEHNFLVLLLVDENNGVKRLARSEKEKKAIQMIAQLFNRVISEKHVAAKEWAITLEDYPAFGVVEAYESATAAYEAYGVAFYSANYGLDLAELRQTDEHHYLENAVRCHARAYAFAAEAALDPKVSEAKADKAVKAAAKAAYTWQQKALFDLVRSAPLITY